MEKLNCYDCKYYDICKFIESAKILKFTRIYIANIVNKIKCDYYEELVEENK